MRDHKKLRAFHLADEVTLMTYRKTANFPSCEIYGITSQMRRARVSLTSNIVEGCARETQRDYVNFLVIANGSLRELHYQFTVALRLGYFKGTPTEKYEQKLAETEKVLGALIRRLR
jgi:four helix bundle protein